MKFVVYQHVNKKTKKRYIGMTNNLKRRWRRDGSEYKSATRFYEALLSEGWDSFEHEILEENLTEEEARKKEIEWIARFDTTNPEHGYNTDKGGHGGKIYKEHPRNMLGKHQTEHQKKNQKALMSDHEFNPMKNGSVVWGVTHEHPKGMLGKHHTEEGKKAVSKKLKEMALHGKAIKAIFPDGTIMEYKTTKEAAEKIGLSAPIILRLARSGAPYDPPTNNQYSQGIAKFKGLIIKRF